MANKDLSKSVEDDILHHLERNANIYTQTQDQHTNEYLLIFYFILLFKLFLYDYLKQFRNSYVIYCKNKLYDQTPQMIPTLNISPQISSLREIKLVNSLLENGDGKINPVKLICQNCKKQVQTKLSRRVGSGAYIVSCILLLCSFGICCLACLPCYVDDCKDIIHLCPNCQHQNGSTPYSVFQ